MRPRPLSWKHYAAGFFVLILLMHLCSCAPKRAVCERNYGPCGQATTERVIERYDTTLYLPGATVYDTLHLHDTLRMERTLLDTTGRAQLRFWRNRAGQLMAECKALPDTVRIYHERERVITVPAEPVKQPWWKSAATYLIVFAAIMLAGYVVLRMF